MKKIVISLDGFSSCGKSTLAKQLANQLNYIFIDSGAMYRAITLYFLQNGTPINSKLAIHEALSKIHLAFKYNEATGHSDIMLNGVDVETSIRGMEVSNFVSEVAALEEVREFAVAQQQAMGIEKGIVMDGRDIGTTVFPNAELKIFVVANPEVRVERRFQEMVAKNPNVTKEEVRNNLALRDHIDSTREFSPLRKATDAIELDNSQLTREEQLQIALKLAAERMA